MKNKKIRLVSGKLFVEKEVPKYKLKKLSIGVVSVMVGTIICFGIQTTEVHAEETITNKVVVEEAQSEAEIKGEVQTELNRVSNGDFEGSQISNKTKWNLKPFGVSSIVTDDGNTYGKIAGETKDEYILSKVPTTPGRTYTVTADIKVVTRSATPSGGYFTARTFENNAYGTVLNQIELKDVMKNWTSQTFEFVAQGSETLIGIVKYNPEDTTIDTEKTEISIDNLKVVEKKQNSYKMIWEDEFNSTDLDKDTWSYMPGTVGRSEQQNYTTSKDNVYIENGLLNFKVTAREKEEVNPRKPKGRSIKYDSGFINTSGKKDFLYGRIEMKAKLPKGQGAFPAFWLMGTSYGWPGGGEIDIMELIGSPTKERLAAGDVDPTDNGRQSNKIIYGTPHFYYVDGDVDKDGSYDPYELGGNVKISEDFYDEYHVFGIDWYPDHIDWYLDGVIYNSMNLVGDARLQAAAVSINRPQMLKLNLATGGDWAGDAGNHLAEDGTTMQVDWVRWSQNDEQKAAAEAWYADAPKLTGVKDIVIKEGTAYDVLSGVSVNKDNYSINASLDDEYMYENTGEMKLVNTIDKNDISTLKPGVYNIHYSVVPTGIALNGDALAKGDVYKTLLKTVTLVVLPESGIKGTEGENLSTISLPSGWKWENPEMVIGSKELYPVIFSTGNETKAARSVTVNIPIEVVESNGTQTETKTDTPSDGSSVINNEKESVIVPLKAEDNNQQKVETKVNDKTDGKGAMLSKELTKTGDASTIGGYILLVATSLLGTLGLGKKRNKK